jgi:GTPase SAR1 family protein
MPAQIFETILPNGDEKSENLKVTEVTEVTEDGYSTLNELLSDDQNALLDQIDQLNAHGISKYVDLPQLVVCGDQSTGKSSVLEALSRLSFPKAGELCTTFATELVLRRGDASGVSVRIKPGVNWSVQDKARIEAFQPEAKSTERFGEMVLQAKSFLQKLQEIRGPTLVNKRGVKQELNEPFFDDVLRVEVSNPRWPSLTLVDLPGLIHTRNAGQENHDIDMVHKLVEKYVKNPKSIILAVLDASSIPARQIILNMAEKEDPEGIRTMGIITKPDISEPHVEKTWIKFAKDEGEYVFDLGWHVVKNMGSGAAGYTLEERDKQEKQWFERSTWKSQLKSDQLGINALRNRLSRLLEDQTREALPSVIIDIETQLEECKADLAKLGEPRGTLEAQKNFLQRISVAYYQLIDHAVIGLYEGPFFDDLEDHRKCRFRAFAQTQNRDFAKTMREKGHRYDITDSLQSSVGKTVVGDWSKSIDLPEQITKEDYIMKIRHINDKFTGRELLGQYNSGLVDKLFREQASRWRKVARAHVQEVLNGAMSMLYSAADFVADEHTAKAICQHEIEAFMKKTRKIAFEKLDEILKPYEKFHAITYDRAFLEANEKIRKEANPADYLQQSLDTFSSNYPKETRDEAVAAIAGLYTNVSRVVSHVQQNAAEFMSSSAEVLNVMLAYYEASHSSSRLTLPSR